ncbi:hypothetical protein CHS0354_005447 [Potamilus streckersoni]|uniref:Uncharacterized protein n=1 Tax=Potamilus streckersoni TaxID=2493646 RepID=A0AAE0T5X5_9BIVA|nr:hypothetical protein CHS0354_005447 [Potamilus streckersoni]
MTRTKYTRSELARQTMKEYEKITTIKPKYPKSNNDLQALQKEIHNRKFRQVLADIETLAFLPHKGLSRSASGNACVSPTKYSRHKRVKKLIKDYENTIGIKPKYPVSNKELEKLQNTLEESKRSKLIFKPTKSSFAGFTSTWKILLDARPLHEIIEDAINFILVRQPRVKILVELRVKFTHAVDPTKFTRPYIKYNVRVAYADDSVINDDIKKLAALITEDIDVNIDAYTRSGSEMYAIRSYRHQIMTDKSRKYALTNFDDKRYCRDGINTFAIGHYETVNSSPVNSSPVNRSLCLAN